MNDMGSRSFRGFPVAAGKLARAGGPLDEAARRHGATVAQLSIAWLLHRSPMMLPDPGDLVGFAP